MNDNKYSNRFSVNEMEIRIISFEGFQFQLKSMSKTEGWTHLFIDLQIHEPCQKASLQQVAFLELAQKDKVIINKETTET